MEPTRLQLVRAGEADIAFMMATERLPGYENLVGQWNEERHRSALVDPRYACFIARDGSERIGFTFLRDWDSDDGVTLIQRIAVCRPGRGHGTVFLRGLIDLVFGQTSTYRLCLGLFPDNKRARRAYETVGFRPEGISRGSAFFGGVHRDELVMAILRPEWQSGDGL